MTERELSIIRALGEEFSTVLADLQRTFEGKMAAQAQAFGEETGFPVGGNYRSM
ncbi:hypothetical protein EC253486_5539 [Escherichia coli 2534-86]|nr:hypothetical protein EC253486_5539 [Escherichia coli 2534-86]